MDCWRTRRRAPGIPTTPADMRPSARFFVLNRRYEEGIEYYRKAIALDPQLFSARSQLGVNLMRMGQDEEAFDQLETCFNNDLPRLRHHQFAAAAGHSQEVRHLQDRPRDSETGQEGARPAGPVLRSGDGPHSGVLREEIQDQAGEAGAGGGLPQPRGFRGAHAGDARPGRAGRDVRLHHRHGQPLGAHARRVPLGIHAVARDEPRVHALDDQLARAAMVHGGPGGARGDRRSRRSGETVSTPRTLWPSGTRSCCP